jgi:formylglycine-generating enzyme required for sulfatase activity
VDFDTRPGRYVCKKDGSTLIFIPPGVFEMGSGGDPKTDETSRHEVELSAFFIGETEVANELFDRFIRVANHVTTREAQLNPVVSGVISVGKGSSWRDPWATGAPASPRDPVVCVSWNDATAYVAWAGLTLPTEAQWERAAAWDPTVRTSRRYSWGDFVPEAGSKRVGNVADECLPVIDRHWGIFVGYRDGFPRLAPVGSFPEGASPCGALDMTGNVWEWCADEYGETPAGAHAGVRPHDPIRTPGAGGDRVLRGGSWLDGPELARTTSRFRIEANAAKPNLGFRVALPLAPR